MVDAADNFDVYVFFFLQYTNYLQYTIESATHDLLMTKYIVITVYQCYYLIVFVT